MVSPAMSTSAFPARITYIRLSAPPSSTTVCPAGKVWSRAAWRIIVRCDSSRPQKMSIDRSNSTAGSACFAMCPLSRSACRAAGSGIVVAVDGVRIRPNLARMSGCRCARSARTSRVAPTRTVRPCASATSISRRTRRGGARRNARRTSRGWPTSAGRTAPDHARRRRPNRRASTTARRPPCSTRPRRSSTRSAPACSPTSGRAAARRFAAQADVRPQAR